MQHMSCMNYFYSDFEAPCNFLKLSSLWKSNRFEMTWGRVNDGLFIFGWTIPLSPCFSRWMWMWWKQFDCLFERACGAWVLWGVFMSVADEGDRDSSFGGVSAGVLWNLQLLKSHRSVCLCVSRPVSQRSRIVFIFCVTVTFRTPPHDPQTSNAGNTKHRGAT